MNGYAFIQQHKANWASAQGKTLAVNNDYSLWQAACKHDWDALKAIPDHAVRNRRKPALIGKYREYLADVLANHNNAKQQNDVLIRNLIWACDAEQWEYALQLADACVSSGQVTTLMERNCATFYTDSLVQFLERHADDVALGLCRDVLERIHQHDVVDPQRGNTWDVNYVAIAKLHRIIAKREKNTKPAAALVHAQKAHMLYPNVGVKTLIEELQRKISPPPQVDGNSAVEAVNSSADLTVSAADPPVLPD